MNVSLQKAMSTAELPTAVIRSKIATKIKTALSLIVTRGADVQRDAKGREMLVFNQGDAGPDWILAGASSASAATTSYEHPADWTYVFRPKLQLYRMPYEELIPILRDGLNSVRLRAQWLESQWCSRQPAAGRNGGGRVKVNSR